MLGDGGACWTPVPSEPLLEPGLPVSFSTVLKYAGWCCCGGYAVFGGGRGGIVALLLDEAICLFGSVAGFGVRCALDRSEVVGLEERSLMEVGVARRRRVVALRCVVRGGGLDGKVGGWAVESRTSLLFVQSYAYIVMIRHVCLRRWKVPG